MSRTAFVTGVTGFVGSHLARELDGQGWEIHALVRPASSLDDLHGLRLHVHSGDITDAGAVLDAMPPGVDAVFHVAASTSIWSGHNAMQDRVNIGGTRNVIEAAVQRNARRFVHTSSFATWGFQDTLLTEESPRTSATDWINYVRTKRIAADLVLEAAQAGRLDAVILSPAHILGPGDRRNWSRMMRMVQRGRLPAMPPGGGSFADVREVARAHVTAYHRAKRGRNYLLGGENATFHELIRITGEVLGRPVPSRTTPAWALQAAARVNALLALVTRSAPDITPESAAMIVRDMRCDSGRAARELDYRITPLRPLVQDTVAWLWKAGLMT